MEKYLLHSTDDSYLTMTLAKLNICHHTSSTKFILSLQRHQKYLNGWPFSSALAFPFGFRFLLSILCVLAFGSGLNGTTSSMCKGNSTTVAEL